MEMRNQRRDSETIDIRNGAWFGEQEALTADRRAGDEQREKKVTGNSQIALNGTSVACLTEALS